MKKVDIIFVTEKGGYFLLTSHFKRNLCHILYQYDKKNTQYIYIYIYIYI